MRRKISFIIFFGSFLFTGTVIAQQYTAEHDSAIYNLNIPKSWQNQRFLYSLTDVIQKQVPVLKDKKVCVGCTNGQYTVSFFLTKPKPVHEDITITNVSKAYGLSYDENKYNLTYSFFASLNVKGKEDTLLYQITIVDSIEFLKKSKVYTGRTSRTDIDYQDISKKRKDAFGTIIETRTPNTIPIPLDKEKFLKEHEKEMLPKEDELRDFIQRRIQEYYNTVKK